jgi:hypothetical protein
MRPRTPTDLSGYWTKKDGSELFFVDRIFAKTVGGHMYKKKGTDYRDIGDRKIQKEDLVNSYQKGMLI